MKTFIYMSIGGVIGFYLAQNKEKETIAFLKKSLETAKREAKEIAQSIESGLD